MKTDRLKLKLEASSHTNVSEDINNEHYSNAPITADEGNEEFKANNSDSDALKIFSNKEKDDSNDISTDDVESFVKIIDEESYVNKSDSDSGNMKVFGNVEGYFNNSDDFKEVVNFLNEDNEDYPNSNIDEIKHPNNASAGDDLKKHDMKPFVNLGNGEINLSDLEELSDEDKITKLESMQRERKKETGIEIVKDKPQSGLKTDDDHR